MNNSKDTATRSSINSKEFLEIKLSNDECSLLISGESFLTDGSTLVMANKNFTSGMQTNDEVFLFISNSISLSFDESEITNPSCVVANFFDAKGMLAQQLKPNLIVIDIPLRMSEFILFKSWLKSNNLQCIPIFYSDRYLQKEQINILFAQKFVDDVVHLEKDFKKLTNKAKFLKNIQLQHNLQVEESVIKNQLKKERGSIKFLFDALFALVAILFLTPVFIVIAIAIKLESKGPIFYSSLRTGVGFKIFKFFKFRTMIVDADKQMDEFKGLNIYTSGSDQANFFKINNDPRVTKIGAFLRNTSLDELPQLFNVLKGDMSIVGNRPLPIYEATTLTTNEWAERFMAPAGITGLWQISKRGNPEMSTEERISIDIDYARNRSTIGDLKILIRTPFALKQKANV